MVRHWLVLLVAFALAFVTSTARAEDAPKAKAPLRKGVAVLATEGATDAAWSLARDVYADTDLRPTLDERGARVLAGETVEGADLKELSELRAGVKGDDAASRQLLASIAERLGVAAVVVVQVEGVGRATARTFVAESKTFEAAVYVGERTETDLRWPGAAAALHKAFAPPPPAPPVEPPPRKKDEKPAPSSGKPFYLSPWFWGAVGAAVLGGVAVFLATRDAESDAIRLQVRLPK